MNLDYRMTFINDQRRLSALRESLAAVSTFAVDLETINWWNPRHERVALIQLAFRVNHQVRVAVIDALAQLDIASLRQPLEQLDATKVMHNASFDAQRLLRHFQISTAPVHDTLLAARRNGERRYSLKAQVEKHLQLRLDKSAQQSDWSQRPLPAKQLDYAARDAAATLLLYEHQRGRGLHGDYRLPTQLAADRSAPEQGALPLADSPSPAKQSKQAVTADGSLLSASAKLSAAALALLGIVAELPSRYSPERLAVSVGEERVGVAGWIVDRMLGAEADLDEASAKQEIAGLCERGFVSLTPTRKLEATEDGKGIWQQRKKLV